MFILLFNIYASFAVIIIIIIIKKPFVLLLFLSTYLSVYFVYLFLGEGGEDGELL